MRTGGTQRSRPGEISTETQGEDKRMGDIGGNDKTSQRREAKRREVGEGRRGCRCDGVGGCSRRRNRGCDGSSRCLVTAVEAGLEEHEELGRHPHLRTKFPPSTFCSPYCRVSSF